MSVFLCMVLRNRNIRNLRRCIVTGNRSMGNFSFKGRLFPQLTSTCLRHFTANRPVVIHTDNIVDTPNCTGCGSLLQAESPERRGYIKPDVLNSHYKNRSQDNSGSLSASGVEPSDQFVLICQRCHYLKNYNTALNITLSADDYKHHLTSLREKRALVILIVDAIDFPASLFPNLHEVLGPRNLVHVVVNKVDLLPNLNPKTLRRMEDYVRMEATNGDLSVEKVWFVSCKTGQGIERLSNEIVYSWGNRGDVYLLGCTNVGKSSLFNHLIVNLCGALPGDSDTVSGLSAPAPVISHWPGTTLGLVSFPVLSAGKRRRLLAQTYKGRPNDMEKDSDNDGMKIRDLFLARKNESNPGVYECLPDIEEVLDEIGLRKPQKKKLIPKKQSEADSAPMNRLWLHDTPGAINDIQVRRLAHVDCCIVLCSFETNCFCLYCSQFVLSSFFFAK